MVDNGGCKMSDKLIRNIKAKGIPVIFFKEGNKVVAYSPALELSTCGDTEDQARTRFKEAVKIFFDEVAQMGTLEDVLIECGWKKITRNSSWSPPIYKHEIVQIPEGVC